MTTRKKLTKAQRIVAWWNAHRARIAALWPIMVPGLLAAYVSYGHIMVVTASHIDPRHNLPGVPLIMPILVDVLMVASARYVKHAKTCGGRVSGLVGFTVGLLASLAANMLASEPDLVSRIVATWPAITLLIVALTMELSGRKMSSPAEIARRRQLKVERQAARKGTWSPAVKATTVKPAQSHQEPTGARGVPTGTKVPWDAASNGHRRPETLTDVMA